VLDDHSKAALKAMRQARDFPANTCAGSRHAALMAEHLIRRGPLPMLTDETRNCGESIAHTVAALWVARTEIERLRDMLLTLRGRLLLENPHAVTADVDGLVLPNAELTCRPGLPGLSGRTTG
jgi:hypothetical protein